MLVLNTKLWTSSPTGAGDERYTFKFLSERATMSDIKQMLSQRRRILPVVLWARVLVRSGERFRDISTVVYRSTRNGTNAKFFLEILFAYQHQCSFLMAVCRPSRNFPNFSFHHKFLEQQQRCKFSLSHRQSIGINLFHNGWKRYLHD